MSNQPGCGRNRRSFTSRTALERLNQVDALFRARGGTVTISEAQDALGWSRSCIFDCCRELLRRGVLVQDSAGGYRIQGTGLEDRVARLELALTEAVAYLVARPIDAAGRNLVDAIGAALGPGPTGLAWSRVISSAWEIVGVMERRGWLLTLIRRTSVTEHPNGVDWRAVFWRPSPDGLEIEESADTAPLAICRAALAALEVSNDA